MYRLIFVFLFLGFINNSFALDTGCSGKWINEMSGSIFIIYDGTKIEFKPHTMEYKDGEYIYTNGSQKLFWKHSDASEAISKLVYIDNGSITAEGSVEDPKNLKHINRPVKFIDRSYIINSYCKPKED